MIAEAEQVADDMFRYPFQLAFAAAFGAEGTGPVGGLPHPSGGAAADVRAWHRQALLDSRPVLVAVGSSIPSGHRRSWRACSVTGRPRRLRARRRRRLDRR
jgi:hypothetical protein